MAEALSAVARVGACLARMEARNPELNAVVARRDAEALAEALDADARLARGASLSALDGLPFTVKDNLLTHGLPTTWGTAALRGYQPGEEERAVTRLRAAGAVLLGKTNVPEFTLEGHTWNPVHGLTRHPLFPALTPGGSSGGAVAAVASGMAPVAIATDGGGSIRRPCGYTGLVGLKPGLGSVRRAGCLPPLLRDFESVGVIARTVGEVRAVYDVIRDAPGHAARTGPARILYVPSIAAHPVDPAIRASVDAAAARLRRLGHDVLASEMPLDLRGFDCFWPEVPAIGLADLFDAHPGWGAQASPRWRGLAAEGAGLRGRLPAIADDIAALRFAAGRLFDAVDLLLMPTAAAMPWTAGVPYPATIDGHPVGPRGHAVFTGWVNAAGLAAVAVPCAPSPEGVPIGMQLIAPAGEENRLLSLADSFLCARP